MSEAAGVQTPELDQNQAEHWTARYLRPVVFIIVALVAFGAYLAFTIPVSVFPATNFPRIVIGVDNGVMPIDQMEVMVTRQIEEAVNTVPGLDHVRSLTSRGSAEVDLFFNWNVDMFQTLQTVNAAVARVQPTLPPTAQITTNRLTFAAFPIMGYSLSSPGIPQTRLWELATYTDQAAIEPADRRVDGGDPGWPGAGVPDRARSRETGSDADHYPEHSGCDREEQPDRFARTD